MSSCQYCYFIVMMPFVCNAFHVCPAGGSVLKYAGKQPLGVTAAADIRAAADTQQQQRTMLPNIEDNTDAV